MPLFDYKISFCAGGVLRQFCRYRQFEAQILNVRSMYIILSMFSNLYVYILSMDQMSSSSYMHMK